MESSGTPGKPADPYPRWSDFVGTVIALVTLTIPLLIVGYYSARPSVTDLSPELSSILIE